MDIAGYGAGARRSSRDEMKPQEAVGPQEALDALDELEAREPLESLDALEGASREESTPEGARQYAAMGDVALYGLAGRVGALVMGVGLVLVLWSLTHLTGCAPDYRIRALEPTPDVVVPPPAGLGRVCVLRPQVFGALVGVRHYDNGVLVGVTRGGRTFFCYQAQPGWHRVSAVTDNRAVLMVSVAPGRTVFVRLVLRVGPDDLFAVEPAKGVALARRLTYIVATPVDDSVPAPSHGPVPALPGCGVTAGTAVPAVPGCGATVGPVGAQGE